MYSRFIKRPADFFVALVALVVLSPILALLAVLTRFKLGSPILFKQERPGFQGSPFTLIKFRSMFNVDNYGAGNLADEDRLTQFGRVMRSWSLDELPELWNIVRGDMSFVGPRPLLPEYLPRYNSRQSQRHRVRPGLTGLAQVNGRNDTTWEQRLELDVRYVETISLQMDFRILAKTVRSVAGRYGIDHHGGHLMPRFPPNPATGSVDSYDDESRSENRDSLK